MKQASAIIGTLLLLGTGAPPPALAAAPAPAAPAASPVARPSYNSGHGFFVLNGRLYDADGHEFRIRGVNRLHWDSDSADGIARSHANTVRWTIDFRRPAADNVRLVRSQSIRYHEIPIVGNWDGTCSSDPMKLLHIVSTWVAQARTWMQLDRYLIVNIANEWGPPDSPAWRDAYIGAVARLRAAGYLGTLLIDSGGCGQDIQDLAKYSAAVFDSDPQKNVMFALHLYGASNDYHADIRAVARGNPTLVTLAQRSPSHPFAPHFDGANNSYSGITAYDISGVRGMTSMNGVQPARQNVGGRPGAWTVTLLVDSMRWPDYAGGGRMVDADGNYALRIARLAALGRHSGAAYIVGEFGPGGGIGASPTDVTPAQVLAAAETNQIGWLAWAWDDNNLRQCRADDQWFSMTYRCGTFTHPADLTRFGREVVLDPRLGLQALASAATVFRLR